MMAALISTQAPALALQQAPRPCSARRAFAGQQLRSTATNGTRCRAFFNFGKKKEASRPEYMRPETREDYSADDVKEYYNYMGMLAEFGSYDRVDAMIATGQHPADLLLLLAASENDAGKVEELLAAGANVNITNADGKTPLDLASKEEVKELLQQKLANV